MFNKVISVAAVSAFANAAIEEDKGLLAGMQMGFFLPDEKSFDNYKCATPEVPEMFKQAEAMIPMMKVMAKTRNEGKDAAWTQVVHDTWHNMAMVGAVVG